MEATRQLVVNKTFVNTINERDFQARLVVFPRSKSAEVANRRRLLIDREPRAVFAASESQQLAADVRASSAGAACPCRTSRKASLRDSTLERREASHDEACSPSADQDGPNLVPREPLPHGNTLETGELLCSITKGAPESSSENERSSVSICELRELQERLRTACLPTGRVSDVEAFVVKPPAAAKGKPLHCLQSTNSISTIAPDTGSGDAEDDRTVAPKKIALMRRMRMVCPSGPVNSTAFTTESLDPMWITTGMNVGSTGSVNTMASIEPFDLPGLPFVTEPEPKHIEIKMGMEAYDGQGEGALQQEGTTAVTTGVATSSQRLPLPPGLGTARASPERVPRYRDLAEVCKRTMSCGGAGAADPVTTLLVRNIPRKYTRHDIIMELKDLGFAGTFDFLHLPLDKKPMHNLGYAFVNFIDKSFANSAMQLIPGHEFKLYRKRCFRKFAGVSLSSTQALERSMQRHGDSAVNAARI